MTNLIAQKKTSTKQLMKALNFDSRLKSEKSQYLYAQSINRFFNWLQANNTPKDKIHQIHIIEYMTELKQAGKKNTYININLKALKRFFKFVEKGNADFKSPMNEIEYFKEEKCTSKHKWLNETQLQELYNNLKSDPTEKGRRDFAIFNMLLYSGIRAQELVNLKLSDIIFEGSNPIEIKVHGKGDKTRYVELNTELYKIIMDYRSKVDHESDYMFLTVPSNVCRDRKGMSYHALYYLVREWGHNIGVQLSPHKMRHTFATHALKKGASLVAVKNRLGHSSITTTESIYIHDEDKCIEYLKFNFNANNV